MQISTEAWKAYVDRLSKLNKTAGDLMREWVQTHGFGDTEALVNYAYSLVTKYGEGSAALSAEMYDAIAAMQKASVPPAVPADTASYREVAAAAKGTIKKSENPGMVASTIERLVKQAGADTMVQNAKRDGAYFAWIPSGDTCAFCQMLASNGWVKASQKTVKGDHAEHIHANCDCTFCIRFNGDLNVKGYNPERYRAIYDNAEGNTWEEKLNSMRRINYREHREEINAQKRAAYALRKNNSLYTYDDPVRDILGAAEDSHPEELALMLAEFKADGVDVVMRDKGMAYQPSPMPGEPGQIIMEPGASISAWMHERQHYLDDKEIEWHGFRTFMNPDDAAKFEERAYDVEIDFVKRLGYTEIVKKLELLKAQSIKNILQNE